MESRRARRCWLPRATFSAHSQPLHNLKFLKPFMGYGVAGAFTPEVCGQMCRRFVWCSWAADANLRPKHPGPTTIGGIESECLDSCVIGEYAVICLLSCIRRAVCDPSPRTAGRWRLRGVWNGAKWGGAATTANQAAKEHIGKSAHRVQNCTLMRRIRGPCKRARLYLCDP